MPERMPNWTEKFGYGEFIHLEHRNCDACMMKGDKLFRVVEENCFKEAIRRKDMEETDVDIQVLSTIPVLFNYWAKPADGLETSRFFNDHIAETVAKEPNHFIGLGTVPLQDIDLAIKEMERSWAQECRQARAEDAQPSDSERAEIVAMINNPLSGGLGVVNGSAFDNWYNYGVLWT